MKGFVYLTLPGHTPSLRKIRTGTQADPQCRNIGEQATCWFLLWLTLEGLLSFWTWLRITCLRMLLPIVDWVLLYQLISMTVSHRHAHRPTWAWQLLLLDDSRLCRVDSKDQWRQAPYVVLSVCVYNWEMLTLNRFVYYSIVADIIQLFAYFMHFYTTNLFMALLGFVALQQAFLPIVKNLPPKTPHLRPTQFKPKLFKGQLYLIIKRLMNGEMFTLDY